MDPTSLGLDPVLTTHATASAPVFALAFAAAKRLKLINPKIEMAVAFGVTAGLNIVASLQRGDPPLPAVSAAATGAVVAMLIHAAATKHAE